MLLKFPDLQKLHDPPENKMYVKYKVEQAPLCDAMMAFAKLMKPRLSVLKGLNYFTISHNGAKNV